MPGSDQNPPDSLALAAETVRPCPRGTPCLDSEQSALLLEHLPGWSQCSIDDLPRIVKVFRFQDFQAALAFANRVGELAEEAGHHPALLVEWGKVTVSWWTHDIGGLHRNDFILAARVERRMVGSGSR
jgi:4a-hydroxytetrahydrobiopterin dehydratase